MADDNNGFLSKSDLDTILATFDEKLEVQRASFKTELDKQANQIHSSYAKKLKSFQSASSTPAVGEDETVSDEQGTASRRPTKRELQSQETIEKLVKRLEDADKNARFANLRTDVTDKLLKNGINPEATDIVFTLLKSKEAFQDEGELGFKMKVDIDGQVISLPIDSAVKHFVKSSEAKFFLAPKGAVGSGGKNPTPTQSNNGAPTPRIEVDWSSVASDLKNK